MSKVSDGPDFAGADESAKGYGVQSPKILSSVLKLERGGFDMRGRIHA
jgi:hypothetical protein